MRDLKTDNFTRSPPLMILSSGVHLYNTKILQIYVCTGFPGPQLFEVACAYGSDLHLSGSEKSLMYVHNIITSGHVLGKIELTS